MPLVDMKIGSGDIAQKFLAGVTLGMQQQEQEQLRELRDMQMTAMQFKLDQAAFQRTPLFNETMARFLDPSYMPTGDDFGVVFRGGNDVVKELIAYRGAAKQIKAENIAEFLKMKALEFETRRMQHGELMDAGETERSNLATQRSQNALQASENALNAPAAPRKPFTTQARRVLHDQVEISARTQIDPELFEDEDPANKFKDLRNAAQFDQLVNVLAQAHEEQGYNGPDPELIDLGVFESSFGRCGDRTLGGGNIVEGALEKVSGGRLGTNERETDPELAKYPAGVVVRRGFRETLARRRAEATGAGGSTGGDVGEDGQTLQLSQGPQDERGTVTGEVRKLIHTVANQEGINSENDMRLELRRQLTKQGFKAGPLSDMGKLIRQIIEEEVESGRMPVFGALPEPASSEPKPSLSDERERRREEQRNQRNVITTPSSDTVPQVREGRRDKDRRKTVKTNTGKIKILRAREKRMLDSFERKRNRGEQVEDKVSQILRNVQAEIKRLENELKANQ